jgi:predicted nucleic acid-binding protein
VRAALVVDASAVLEMLKGSPAGARLRARLDDPRLELIAPHLIDVEIVSALRRWTLTGGVPAAVASERLEVFLTIPLRRYAHRDLIRRAWQLRAAMSAYDAAYVALAEGLAAPLLTADPRLAATRGHAARIEVL